MDIKLLSFLGVVMSIGMAVSTNASALPIQPSASDVTLYYGYRDICRTRLNSGINDVYIVNRRNKRYYAAVTITSRDLSNATNKTYKGYDMKPLQKIFIGCARDSYNHSIDYKITDIYNSL